MHLDAIVRALCRHCGNKDGGSRTSKISTAVAVTVAAITLEHGHINWAINRHTQLYMVTCTSTNSGTAGAFNSTCTGTWTSKWTCPHVQCSGTYHI